ncbi:hypothetical protein [Leadbetterella byssophila]|uniref:hypothetical protein n=1 Tax=Leadbetterella byssophila TaxID=316068 RepID=UPI0039A08B54
MNRYKHHATVSFIKKWLVVFLLAACSKGESPLSNIDLPDDGGPKPPVNNNKNTPITFENSTFSGSVLVTFTDNTKVDVKFENGKGTVSLSPRADKTIASLQPENEALILIGRKEKSEIRLNYSNGTLSHRMAIDGFVPIGSYAEFQLIGKDAVTLANSYQLEDHLDLMSVEWVPLGKTNAPFKGNFDGDNYQLDNLKISVSADDGVTASIFGTLGGTETNFIKNIIVKSGEIKARYAATIAGGLRATAHTIENCINHIPVTGGLAGAYGIASSGRVVNCRNFGTITGIVAEGIGGTTIFDSVNEGEISAEYAYGIGGGQNVKNCINKGNITGSKGATGISGVATVEDSINEGEIVGGEDAKGIGGNNIKNCINKGNITGSTGAAGIGGGVYVENCINEGDIYSETGTAMGIGRETNKNCINEGDIYSETGTAEGIGGRYINKNCTNKGKIIGGKGAGGISLIAGTMSSNEDCINEGDIYSESGTAVGIGGRYINKNCTNKGKIIGGKGAGGISLITHSSYKVEDCANEGDIYSEMEFASGIGGYAKNCINKGKITGGKGAAGISAHANTVNVENCINEGNIYGAGYIGGIIDRGKATNCVNKGKITVLRDTEASVGGIVGAGAAIKCVNEGEVQGSKGNIGGVVGFDLQGETNESKNKGMVRGEGVVGGVVGYTRLFKAPHQTNIFLLKNSNEGEIRGLGEFTGGVYGYIEYSYSISSNSFSSSQLIISKCSNTGDIYGNGKVGGITSYLNGRITIESSNNHGKIVGGSLEESHTGGIAGGVNSASYNFIVSSFNTGEISGGKNVGGIVGSGGGIYGCYNAGTVSGSVLVGGISGGFRVGSIISCYNKGVIQAAAQSGGIAGESTHAIRGCYNIGEIKGDPRSGNGPIMGTGVPAESNYYLSSTGRGGNGISAFSASDWPAPQINSSYKLWIVGDGGKNIYSPVQGAYWKSLGSWNNGEPVFPKLHFEND